MKFLEPIPYGGLPCSDLIQRVLPQLGMPDTVNTPTDALPFLRSGMEMGGGRCGRIKKEREGELGLICKMKKIK